MTKINTQEQEKSLTAIVVVEGGGVQNVYCPNPNLKIEWLILDYDCEDGGIDGCQALIKALEDVDAEERKFKDISSIEGILKEKYLKLKKLKQQENLERGNFILSADAQELVFALEGMLEVFADDTGECEDMETVISARNAIAIARATANKGEV